MKIRDCLHAAFKRSAFVMVFAWMVVLSSSTFGLPQQFICMRSQLATLQENFAVVQSALEQADCGSSQYITGALLHELLRRAERNLD